MNNEFPQIIYLDTNAVRELSYGISNVEYLKLKEFCKSNKISLAASEVVIYEWYYMQRREVVSEISRIKQSINKINLLLNITQPEYKEPKLYPVLISKVNKYMREAGIRWVKTTRKISIKKLISLAARKIKPFEEKGEKGFRDMVLLLTAVEDMKKLNYRNAILITNDNVFKHEEIKIHLQGKVLKIMNNFNDSLTYLENVMKDKAIDYFTNEANRLLKYLQTKKDDIFKYVIENAQVSEDFLRGDMFFIKLEEKFYGNIEKIIEVKPTDISSAFPSLTRKTETQPKYFKDVTFTVEVDFKLSISPINLFNKPKFSIANPSEFQKTKFILPSIYGESTEKTVKRPINVEAVVKDKNGNYSELVIKRIITF